MLLLFDAHRAMAGELVRLQLKWEHQFQFAGYYAAKEKGYYRSAGLDVEFIPGSPDIDPVQRVLDGTAEFGVGSTELLLLRQRGIPVVSLAVIFQHSPLALITLKNDNLQSIHDLAGRRIMIEPGSSELQAYLQKENITTDKYQKYSHGFSVHDLLNGSVDAMSTYVTDEPFDLNVAGKEYLLFSPRSAGIDFYGDNLFTTEQLIRLKPDMVRAFRKASLLGWEYAMQHPEELVQLIYSHYSKRHSIEHLRFEAHQMKSLLQTSLVEIGHMNPGRWRHIADTYAELGMMKPGFDLTGFIYDEHPPPPNLKKLYTFIGAAFAAIIIVSALATYIHRINKRLRRDAAALIQSETDLRESRSFLSEIIENSGALMFVKDRDFRYELVNRKWEETTGLTRAEVIGRTDAELFPGDVGKAFRENDEMVMAREEPLETEEVLEDCTGRRFFISIKLPLRDADGAIKGLCGILTEITRRKTAEAALAELSRSFESLSITDSLTGIANRRHFDDILAMEYGRHVRSGNELSLIMLDIDHFKAFNDTYGHLKGDECLRKIGRFLQECVSRSSDLVARYGGEEFACILPETDRNGAVIIAEQIRRGIEALGIPHSMSSVSNHVTASLGVVTADCSQYSCPQAILEEVDTLLYQAKSSGRNRIKIVASSISLISVEEITGSFVQLVWKDIYCSGHHLIDAQHLALFNVANELFNAILSGRSSREISLIIARLLDDVSRHFRDERMILENTRFPNLKNHLEEHDRLFARGVELAGQFDTATLSVGDIFQFLAYDVIMIHMLGADREFFQYVAEKQP